MERLPAVRVHRWPRQERRLPGVASPRGRLGAHVFSVNLQLMNFQMIFDKLPISGARSTRLAPGLFVRGGEPILSEISTTKAVGRVRTQSTDERTTSRADSSRPLGRCRGIG